MLLPIETRDESRRPLIVVAEDDDEMRYLLVRTLGRDHDVEAIDDGASLLARLVRPPRPALLVTDLRMPWLDGIEALRQAGALNWVPTILVTAFPDPQVELRAARADVELLAKPFDFEVLQAVVQRTLAALSPWSDPEHDGYGPIRSR